MASAKDECNPKTGLPLIDEEEKSKNAKKGLIVVNVLALVLFGIGYGIAYCIYRFGSTDLYDRRLALA